VGVIPLYVRVCSMLADQCSFMPPKLPQTQCCIAFQRYCSNSRKQNFLTHKTNQL